MPVVDKIAFTGSAEVGRLIVQAAAGNLKKVSLELGGKSPVIVFPDADLSIAVPGAARAIFNNSGQVCAAGSRLYAHASVFDRLVEGVAQEAGKLKIGHGLDPDTQMGPLVSQEQLDRVSGYVAQGRSDGAKVVTGGSRVGNEGYFIAPTDPDRHPAGHVGRARGNLRPGAVRDDLQRRRPRPHCRGSEPHHLWPCGEHLDARPQHRPQDGAPASGRLGRRQHARHARRRRCRSAATSSPAGAARRGARCSTSIPRSRPW